MTKANAPDHYFIYPLYRDMIQNRINYGYRGTFSREVSDGLIEFAQGIFNQTDLDKKLKKRVVFILVECVQNITRHQELPEEASRENDGIFLIQSLDEMYNISQGNMIRNEHLDALKEKLDMVNSMDQEELKKQYKGILAEAAISEKGGAGLGLIEIARRSGNKIRYTFKPVDDTYSFFYMDTLISDPAGQAGVKPDTFYDLDITGKLMSVLQENKVNLIYCSQFAGKQAFDLLSIIENLRMIKDQDLLIRKRIYLVLVELLQNIYHHAAECRETESKTGILLFGADRDVNRITTGNLIKNKEVPPVLKHFEHLNALDHDGLEEIFKEKLANRDFSNPAKNGIGLIDLLMRSGKPLIYNCIPVDEDHSFLSVQVNIDNQP
jgi:hypothetical protein